MRELPECSAVFNLLPSPPDGSSFSLKKLEIISVPRPYVITPKHVSYASDHCSGMLTEEAIAMSGARCGWEGCRLSLPEHELMRTLFVCVPQNKDLNAVPGLGAYLQSVKALSLEHGWGIDGFAFPLR